MGRWVGGPKAPGILLAVLCLLGLPGRVEPPAGAARLAPRPVCEATYTVTDPEAEPQSVEVLVRNNGAPRLSWQVTWTFAGDEVIGAGWNAAFGQSGPSVSATNLAWNGVLSAGGTVVLGIEVTARELAVAPTDFRLDGVLCNQPSLPVAQPSPARPIPAAVAQGPLPPPLPLPLPPGRRVVGYIPTWAPALGYMESAIDFESLTHIAHFSVMPRPDGSIALPVGQSLPSRTLVDLAHRHGVAVVLVVGGYGEEPTRGFSALAATPETRRAFARQLVAFLDRHGYDGVDLDWEFPVEEVDRDNLTALVAEVRGALGPARSLSLAVPPGARAGRWFDIPALMPYLDWLGVMTYDLYSALWHDQAEHHAPLYSVVATDGSRTVSVDSARAYYLGRGAPAANVLVGLPFYGQRYDAATAPRQPLANRSGGPVDYRDIAPLIGQGWTLDHDSAAGAPYLRRDDRPGLLTFDDPTSIAAKCAYVVDHDLGGVILWHLGQDRLGDTQPLLTATSACRAE